MKKMDLGAQTAEVRLAAQCIGLDHKQPFERFGKRMYRPYRNYYDCRKGSETYDVFMVLSMSGYARKRPEDLPLTRFYMTRKGLEWLGKRLGIVILTQGYGWKS